ncbi:MAG: DUF7002 family protein [Vulcanimicrobiaceae bacterium]
MNVDTLIEQYPVLWHMADVRNVEGILQHGLLSTSQLLRLYEVKGREREEIEAQHRRDTIPISSASLPTCYIRDQRPMSASRIAASLTDASPEEFFRFLNGHVFFWPSESRLSRMNNAPPYRDAPQLVFALNSGPFIRAHEARIRLSPINSGCTTPYAHARSIRMFERIDEFDWNARKMRKSDRVAEIAVLNAVPNVWEYVLRLDLWQCGKVTHSLRRPYDDSLPARLARLGRS